LDSFGISMPLLEFHQVGGKCTGASTALNHHPFVVTRCVCIGEAKSHLLIILENTNPSRGRNSRLQSRIIQQRTRQTAIHFRRCIIILFRLNHRRFQQIVRSRPIQYDDFGMVQ
jgi:hypothetical protein